MKPRTSQREQLPLPIISGVEVGNLVAGQKANILQVQAALELLQANEDNPRWQIKSIDVSKKYCLVAVDRNHVEVTFDLENIDRQLMKLSRLFDHIEAEKRDLRTVNLLVKYNTPVTFYNEEPEELPAATPAPGAKPGSDKKGESRSSKSTGKSESSRKESTPAPENRKPGIIKKFRLIQ